jgi:hypothetical protein
MLLCFVPLYLLYVTISLLVSLLGNHTDFLYQFISLHISIPRGIALVYTL